MGDGFEAFEINEFDIEHAFNPLGGKRKRFTKHQQTYGIWADEEEESGSDKDDFSGFKKGKKSTKSTKDYTTPVSFISGGVKEGDKISKTASDDVLEDDDDDEPIQIIKSSLKTRKTYQQQKSTKGKMTIKNEMLAGFRGPGTSSSQENYADWERYTKGIGSKLLSKVFFKTSFFLKLV